MALPTADERLPPGFRFHPTDQELIMYYLKKKVLGKRICDGVISELDIYQFVPWKLPDMACLQSRDLNWYFFCPRLKYGNSGGIRRATESGYWKSTGPDRTVLYKDRKVGKIKTLVYHHGKSPNGERKDWVMHEFRLEDSELNGVGHNSYVICKIFKKSGLGPKNGEHYGAPFIEEEWEDDVDENETEGIAASLNAGPSGSKNQEDSAVTGILERGHHNGGLVVTSSEQVSHGNGAVSTVDQVLTDPNARVNAAPVSEGPQGPAVVDDDITLWIEALLEPPDNDNTLSIEELLEPSDNFLDACMFAHGTGHDEVMQDADHIIDETYTDLEPLEEFPCPDLEEPLCPSYFNNYEYAPQSTYPDGNFLEERDLDGRYFC